MNIGPTELVIILVIALIVFGPRKLPISASRSDRRWRNSAAPPMISSAPGSRKSNSRGRGSTSLKTRAGKRRQLIRRCTTTIPSTPIVRSLSTRPNRRRRRHRLPSRLPQPSPIRPRRNGANLDLRRNDCRLCASVTRPCRKIGCREHNFCSGQPIFVLWNYERNDSRET